MGQSTPFKPIALVVEDDELQRELVVMLLEESEMGVIQCDSAESALQVIEKLGCCDKCGNKRFTEITLLNDEQMAAIVSGAIDFPDREAFLAEFSAIAEADVLPVPTSEVPS